MTFENIPLLFFFFFFRYKTSCLQEIGSKGDIVMCFCHGKVDFHSASCFDFSFSVHIHVITVR